MKKIVNAILSVCLVLSLVACSSKEEEWIDNDVNNIKITPEKQEIYDKAVEPYLGLDLVHEHSYLNTCQGCSRVSPFRRDCYPC